MLEAIKTVFGAVATKDIVPILTHILIYEGRMQAGDGCVTIDTPFQNNITPVAVPGQKLLQAIKSCGSELSLSITETGRLSIKSGKFRALLSALPKENFPIEIPKGKRYPIPQDFMAVVSALRPFVSKDASRPWSMGILFQEGFAYSTNNIALARNKIDWKGPTVLLPLRSLDDLIAMQEKPQYMFAEENSVSFMYSDGTWLKSQVSVYPWPDVKTMLDNAAPPEEDIPPNLLEDVIKVHAFCTNVKFPQIFFGDCVKSDSGGGDEASVEGYNLPKSVWHADQIELVLSHATKIDFSNYPKACAFSNDNGLFGIFVGVRA